MFSTGEAGKECKSFLQERQEKEDKVFCERGVFTASEIDLKRQCFFQDW